MWRIALKMLMADRAKYGGLLLGIAFTAFLVTFASAYFSGFMTRGFSLIAEDGAADVWVMDPAVNSVEQTINLPSSALDRVRNVEGVRYAAPLLLGSITARFANGRFQPFQVIGVDDATLMGAPQLTGAERVLLRSPDAAIADSGGTHDKLLTPTRAVDVWPPQGAHLDAPLRQLAAGDVLLSNDQRIKIMGISHTLPRFPPRPLLYMTYSNALHILPQEHTSLTFVLVVANKGIPSEQLARRIEQQTGLRARSSNEFITDTLRWYLLNSEDVGDMASMLILAMTVGFGTTGVLLYIFTYENLKQYAVLNVMGATPRVLLQMIFIQATSCALLGSGLGLGMCTLFGKMVEETGYPFRLLWFSPLLGIVGVLLVSLTAAAISARPLLKLHPMIVFAGR